MFIPIGTDRPRKRPTLITYWLVALNIAVFLGEIILSQSAPELHARIAGTMTFFPTAPSLLGLIGYQFLHGDFLHLLFNMLFLWVFGPPVEDRFGRVGFLSFYLVGGAVAAGVHAAFSINPVIGASGAISGVTGSFLVLFPLTRIRILLFFILIGVFMIPAWWFIAFAVARDLLSQAWGGGNIAYAAHLGGYAYGAAISMLLLWRRVIPREPCDLFSIGRQAHRRRQFREASRKHGAGIWAGQAAIPKKVARRTKPTKQEEDRSRRRQEIQTALGEGDLAKGTAQYLELLGSDPGAGLARDAQLAVANHLFSSGDHTNAATAYEVFLKRQRGDREADHVRLMLALVSARYLNDPVRAGALLSEVRTDSMDADHRNLADSLRREIGEE